MKLLNCSPEEFNRIDNRNEMELDLPRNTPVLEALSLPRVGLCNFWGSMTVMVIVKSDHEGKLFLWALYKHMFKEDEGLPRFSNMDDRNVSLEDIVQMVRDGKLYERAIPAAMELLL